MVCFDDISSVSKIKDTNPHGLSYCIVFWSRNRRNRKNAIFTRTDEGTDKLIGQILTVLTVSSEHSIGG